MIKEKRNDTRALIKLWLKFWRQINDVNRELHVLNEAVLMSSQQIKAANLMASWRKLTDNASKLYSILDRLYDSENIAAPVEIKLPWDSPKFRVAWENWVAYMAEQFNTNISSRTQEQRLLILYKMSEGNEDKAILIINFSIANMYKAFFVPEEPKQQQQSQQTKNRKDDDFS